ncbi:hypothetical protein FRC11_005039 [Ceratobasidium sp. 423]|nr:hypothetical protein FRC11_005039 [Ceratobasidium sp. 423]
MSVPPIAVNSWAGGLSSIRPPGKHYLKSTPSLITSSAHPISRNNLLIFRIALVPTLQVASPPAIRDIPMRNDAFYAVLGPYGVLSGS